MQKTFENGYNLRINFSLSSSNLRNNPPLESLILTIRDQKVLLDADILACLPLSLAEIETTADSLPSEQKKELFRFLAMRLRKERTLPKPRIYSEEELATMFAEDEADGERFRQGR